MKKDKDLEKSEKEEVCEKCKGSGLEAPEVMCKECNGRGVK